MKCFDHQGNITFGTHRGKHHSNVPKSWLDWACANVKAFQEELGRTKAQPPAIRPKPTGRYYQLRPRNSQIIKGMSPPPGGGGDPDDAVDHEDDPGMGRYFEQD